MKMKFARFALGLAAIGLSHVALADKWPEKPITFVVPFAPGAASDGLARILAKELTASLGQSVIVENKTGAGGTLGPMHIARSNPDGYTIGIGATGAIAINPHVPSPAPLNVKDLEPIAKLADIPIVLAANASAGYADLSAFLEAAKKAKDGMPVGNNGLNTTQHLAAQLLMTMTKAPMVAVPYKGSAPAATALLGGEVSVAMVDLTSVYPHIKAGKLVALGVTTPKRSKAAPELPTIAEGGVPGYAAAGWLGLFAPANTPQPIVNTIANAVQKALSKPEVEKKLIALAAEPDFIGPQAFAKFLAAENDKWATAIAAGSKSR